MALPDWHDWRRVPVGPYRHRYRCSCGWETPETDNGDPAANAAIVRHEIAAAKERTNDGRAEMGTTGRVVPVQPEGA